jgi:hypothetical protein
MAICNGVPCQESGETERTKDCAPFGATRQCDCPSAVSVAMDSGPIFCVDPARPRQLDRRDFCLDRSEHRLADAMVDMGSLPIPGHTRYVRADA